MNRKITNCILIVLFAISAIVLQSCSHTNELSKFNLKNRSILYKNSTSPEFAGSNISFDGKFSGSRSIVEEIIQTAASIFSESKVKEKINRVISADTISNVMSEEFKNSLVTYFNVNKVDSISDNPDFLVNTEFIGFNLTSRPEGVFAMIRTGSRIVERKTAKLVWENKEIYTLPLRNNYAGYYPDSRIRTAAGTINAITLMNMSDEEIRKVIKEVTKEAAKEMSETLREDIAEMNEGK
ncbi:hypothetical protein BH10BAC5_BH10BAC5_12390 [soil metagenome]